MKRSSHRRAIRWVIQELTRWLDQHHDLLDQTRCVESKTDRLRVRSANFAEGRLWNSSAETVRLAAAICKHCAFEFAAAPLQSSSGGLPYITLPEGRISVTIEGETQTWPNLEAFQQHVQRKRSKLPMHVRYSGNRATAPVRL